MTVISEHFLVVGTYTRPAPYLEASNGEGLYVMSFDDRTGQATLVSTTSGIENPSYLCVSPDGRMVHAIWEVVDWESGLISSYLLDASGNLSHAGIQSSQGALACYIALDSQARAAVVANYITGTVAMLPVAVTGNLKEATTVDQHQGSGPNTERQEGPHAHCIVVDPTDTWALSADLGTDTIHTYALDFESYSMESVSELRLPAGSGPRHLVFHPSLPLVFVILELRSEILSLRFDERNGATVLIGGASTLPSDFKGESHCADIHVHPSGRYVYGSNRGHDSIAVFSINPDSGRLEPSQIHSTGGRTPRSFVISPNGKWLLVANQDSDSIVSFPINSDGTLRVAVAAVDVPTPVCLKFVGEARLEGTGRPPFRTSELAPKPEAGQPKAGQWWRRANLEQGDLLDLAGGG